MSTKVYFINSEEAQYSDHEFAWFQSLVLTDGIIGDKDTGVLGLEVTENGTPDMSVLVSAGKALVEITIDGRTFKVVAESDSEEQIIVGANTSGSNRVDAVIVRVDKDTTVNELKNNIVTLEIVEGSGTSPLSDAAIDTAVGNDGWYRLADITVPDSTSDIEDEDITDTREKVNYSKGVSFDNVKITSEVSSATPTIDTDQSDVHRITALAEDITNMSTNLSGNPDLWQFLVIEIIGTATRSITWGTSFEDGGVYSLPTTTDGTTPLKVLFNWNGSKWSCIGVA